MVDVVVVGAALQAGSAPASKTNVPGYIRGFDVRTGEARCAPAYLPTAKFPVAVDAGAVWTRDDR